MNACTPSANSARSWPAKEAYDADVPHWARFGLDFCTAIIRAPRRGRLGSSLRVLDIAREDRGGDRGTRFQASGHPAPRHGGDGHIQWRPFFLPRIETGGLDNAVLFAAYETFDNCIRARYRSLCGNGPPS